MRSIELEIRAEVPLHHYETLLAHLRRHGKLVNRTKRCSAMFFGHAGGKPVDLRVRVTNGDAEVVVKKGAHHAANRVEFSQPVAKADMAGLARVFSLLGFEAKVGERITVNFDFGRGTIVSLVKAGRIAYMEVERMTDQKHYDKDKAEVLEVLKELGYKPLIKSDFDDLCHRLTKHEDWIFRGTPGDITKLKRILRSY